MTLLISHLNCQRIWQRSCQSGTICFSDYGLCNVHALKLASFLFIDCIHAIQLSNAYQFMNFMYYVKSYSIIGIYTVYGNTFLVLNKLDQN